ncbi:hypothetical protein TNCV_2983281 [Trichonephila clavipes]|nr:hypothetical protein TNCV_2983281 [Trichonephila clavipes]
MELQSVSSSKVSALASPSLPYKPLVSHNPSPPNPSFISCWSATYGGSLSRLILQCLWEPRLSKPQSSDTADISAGTTLSKVPTPRQQKNFRITDLTSNGPCTWNYIIFIMHGDSLMALKLVSARIIRNRIQQSGLSARRPLLVLPLTQSNRRLCRQWCDKRMMWALE